MHRPAAKPLPCLRHVGFYTSRHFRGNFDLQVLLLQTALTLLSLFFFTYEVNTHGSAAALLCVSCTCQ